MKRPLSRNRRIAVVSASSASIVATMPLLLGVNAHSGISDFARGATIGFTIVTSIALLAVSMTFMSRERSACSRTR